MVGLERVNPKQPAAAALGRPHRERPKDPQVRRPPRAPGCLAAPRPPPGGRGFRRPWEAWALGDPPAKKG